MKRPYHVALTRYYEAAQVRCHQIPYCADLTGIYAGKTDLYNDPRHPNPEGYRLLGEAIFKELRDRGLLILPENRESEPQGDAARTAERPDGTSLGNEDQTRIQARIQTGRPEPRSEAFPGGGRRRPDRPAWNRTVFGVPGEEGSIRTREGESPPRTLEGLDRQIWEEELSDFVPARLFDAHCHIYRADFDLNYRTALAHKEDFKTETVWTDCDIDTVRQVESVLMPGRQITRLAFPFPYYRCDFRKSNQFAGREVRKEPGSAALMLVEPSISAHEVEETILKHRLLGLKPYAGIVGTEDLVAGSPISFPSTRLPWPTATDCSSCSTWA